ncbi:MAG: phage scaffolding protein [Exiguobacterium sp.]|nr:phage scaffolding protein [Exiguobacterium sp.]
MKNALEIVKGLGIELTDEQAETLNTEINANYKTVAEFDKKLKKVEGERDTMKAQFESATETLKGFEGVDVEAINKKLTDYEQKIQQIETDYQKKLEEREFNDVLKDALAGVKFSSQSAKKAVVEDIQKAGLKLMNGKILGLTEYLEELKKSDADAFVSDTPKATFTAPKETKATGKLTKDEIMKIRDTSERQKAIAENIELFTTR